MPPTAQIAPIQGCLAHTDPPPPGPYGWPMMPTALCDPGGGGGVFNERDQGFTNTGQWFDGCDSDVVLFDDIEASSCLAISLFLKISLFI